MSQESSKVTPNKNFAGVPSQSKAAGKTEISPEPSSPRPNILWAVFEKKSNRLGLITDETRLSAPQVLWQEASRPETVRASEVKKVVYGLLQYQSMVDSSSIVELWAQNPIDVFQACLVEAAYLGNAVGYGKGDFQSTLVNGSKISSESFEANWDKVKRHFDANPQVFKKNKEGNGHRYRLLSELPPIPEPPEWFTKRYSPPASEELTEIPGTQVPKRGESKDEVTTPPPGTGPSGAESQETEVEPAPWNSFEHTLLENFSRSISEKPIEDADYTNDLKSAFSASKRLSDELKTVKADSFAKLLKVGFSNGNSQEGFICWLIAEGTKDFQELVPRAKSGEWYSKFLIESEQANLASTETRVAIRRILSSPNTSSWLDKQPALELARICNIYEKVGLAEDGQFTNFAIPKLLKATTLLSRRKDISASAVYGKIYDLLLSLSWSNPVKTQLIAFFLKVNLIAHLKPEIWNGTNLTTLREMVKTPEIIETLTQKEHLLAFRVKYRDLITSLREPAMLGEAVSASIQMGNLLATEDIVMLVNKALSSDPELLPAINLISNASQISEQRAEIFAAENQVQTLTKLLAEKAIQNNEQLATINVLNTRLDEVKSQTIAGQDSIRRQAQGEASRILAKVLQTVEDKGATLPPLELLELTQAQAKRLGIQVTASKGSLAKFDPAVHFDPNESIEVGENVNVIGTGYKLESESSDLILIKAIVVKDE